MRSPSFTHYLPSRSTDRPSDGSPNPRVPLSHPPNDTLHSRSVLRTPNLLRTHLSSQQHPRQSHHSPLTPRLDMYPPRQIPNSVCTTFNDSPLSLPTHYTLGQVPWIPHGYDSRRQQNDSSNYTNYLRTARNLDDHQRNSLPQHAFRQNQNSDYFISIAGFRVAPRASSADAERDRQARACGQPPPLSTSYGLRLDYASQHNTLPFSHYHVPHDSKRPEGDQRQHDPKTSAEHAQIQAPRPKPHALYSRLDQLVRRDQNRAIDHVSLDDVIDLYRQEIALQEKICQKRKGKIEKRDAKFRVIGAPLRDVLMHASSVVTIGEHQHDIPTVVVACIEELTRTGIYQQGLFRTLPNRDRYIQLIDTYNSGADYGANFSMHKQTMPDICAVFSTFISGLPHPLLDPRLYSGFWHWCVKPSVRREEVRRKQLDAEDEENRARGDPLRLLRTLAEQQHQQPKAQDNPHLGGDDDPECHQIMIAEIILRFLPTSHLSLLIYLCGFFTQLPLCPENEIQFEDIARIYGPKVLGGTVKASSQKMMVWLLSRWHKISEGLLADFCGASLSSTGSPAQEELFHMEDTNPPLKAGASRRSRSTDSDRSSSSSNSPCDQAESSTGRYKKKRSIESMQESDDGEASSRSRRPSRRHRLGHRNNAYEHQKKTSMEDLSAPANSRVNLGLSRDTPDCSALEVRTDVTRLEDELLRNKTFTDDAARLLSEKVEQLDGTLGEKMWHNASAPKSCGLVTTVD